MKLSVLIVAKTHMNNLACIGGLRLDTNQNVRLLQADASYQPGDVNYEVGQEWELDIEQFRAARPPHVESVLVFDRCLIRQENNLYGFLLDRVDHWRGAPTVLFDGYVRATSSGSGYIARDSGLPQCSTGFWIPDRPLQRVQADGKTRYKYPQASDVRFLPYVGYAPPVDTIPAGTLVRVSLARWWRPNNDADIQERCYLQLSGWFAPSTREHPTFQASSVVRSPNRIDNRRPEHSRDNAEWSEAEDATLKQLVFIGEHVNTMEQLFQRRQGSIHSRMVLLNLDQEYRRHH